jgi:Lipocalin-like domain
MFRVIVALGMALVGSPALAQSARDLVGTYSFAHEMGIDGHQSNVGAKGILILDAGGRYALTIIAPNVPNVASSNRRTATADEAKAIVAATTAHFGTYSVDNGILVFKIERASFPNWNGTEQKRPFTLRGDELHYSVSASSGSGSSITLTWNRARR